MTQPNLLFIMPDQLRADFLSCYGADFIDTPHIDSLAARGVRYQHAYTTHPICVPARAALLTGMNAIKNGVTDNGQWIRPDYRACGIQTWPELLNAQGYYTAAVGKMHFYPWDIKMGFQYRVAAEDKRWIHVRDDYYHFLQAHGHRKYHGNEHEGYFENKGAIINKLPLDLIWDRFVGQEACRFLRTYGSDGPFAMMVGFPGPHCPYDPSPEYAAMFNPDDMPPSIPEVPGDAPKLRQNNIDGNRMAWNGVDHTHFNEAHKKKIRAHYAGLVKQIDDEVGTILATLREIGQLENTVIIFASDHGDYLGDHNLIGKGSYFESSIRVPMIVCGPAIPQGEVYNGLVTLNDVTATLLALGGSQRPGYMDSRVVPGLGIETTPRNRIIGAISSGWMIQEEGWRLAQYSTGEHLLFYLPDDPHEQHNLIGDPTHAARLRSLETELHSEIMRAATASHWDKRVYNNESLSSDPGFGREGWQRAYPQPW